MSAIWSVRLNFVAGAVDICALPPGACTVERGWLFTALRRRSAAEIPGAARLSVCARSVGLLRPSPSRCVSLSEKE